MLSSRLDRKWSDIKTRSFNDLLCKREKRCWSFTNCKEALGNILCRKETMLMEKVKREGWLLWMVFEADVGEDGDCTEGCFRFGFESTSVSIFKCYNADLFS